VGNEISGIGVMGPDRGRLIGMDRSAGMLKIGDRLLLDGYVREVVRVETLGTEDDEMQCRISFVNGATVTVPWAQTFEIVESPGDRG
jgi:hypothetical protein